jgi:hypothetical protein
MKHLYQPLRSFFLLLLLLVGSRSLAQTDVEFVELDLRANPAGDSLQVYVRVTGPTDFSGLVSEIKYTLRWPTSSTATIPPNGQTQFCQTGYNIQYYQNTPAVSGGFRYATMNAFGLPQIINACPSEYWPTGQWKLIQRIKVDNITGCTAFQIVNDGYTAISGRETYVELMGWEIDHAVEPTPAYMGQVVDCAPDCLGTPGGTALPGTPCNDGDPGTGNDTYDANCNCIGQQIDCNGVVGGTASIDQCGVCSGGLTGIIPNSTCLDCAGWPFGSAYLDDCGVCVGGNTGLTPCSNECNAAFQIVQATFNGTLVPFTLNIVNTSTGDGTLSYAWDNIASTAAEPTHVLNTGFQEVAFTLCLTVTNDISCTSVHCETVYVDANGIMYPYPPIPCVGSFDMLQTAAFTALLTSTSTAFGLQGVVWSLPNGQVIGTSDQLEYTFPAAGTYEICITPVGLGCEDATTCQILYVSVLGNITTVPVPGECEAGYWVIQAYQLNMNNQPEPVPFHLWVWNLSIGDGNYQFLWDFGDGTTSTTPFPLHVYPGTGPYQLCLTMWDGTGCTDTYCDSIGVNNDGFFEGMILESDVRSALTISVISSLPTSIATHSPAEELQVWPNPATDVLNISLNGQLQGRTEVSILNMEGRLVQTLSRTFNEGTHLLTVPLVELADGMYMLRIQNGGQVMNHRFMRSR